MDASFEEQWNGLLNRAKAAKAVYEAAVLDDMIDQSAPLPPAAHNSGEGDPSVMPDYGGADTSVLHSGQF